MPVLYDKVYLENKEDLWYLRVEEDLWIPEYLDDFYYSFKGELTYGN